MRLGLYLGYWGVAGGAEELAGTSQEAERLGYDSVWTAEAEARRIQDLYLEGRKDDDAAAVPAALIDLVSLAGPRAVVRDRLAAFREAGVGSLLVVPMAFGAEERADQLRQIAELAAV